jgi:arabinofuranan 3-O-arabinosyltransferase
MALAIHTPDHPSGFQLTRPLELICFALCVAQAVYIAASFVQGSWLVDPSGQAIATDFVNVWAAGRQVLDGQVAAVYDVAIHKTAEVTAVGHEFDGEYPWIYPPTFLFAATLLALLPYVVANTAWMLLTFPAYVAAVRAIIGHRIGILLACAFPGLLANVMAGQNGFATAALFGGALVLLQRSPVLAGCLIGLLSFKPHLGILIPVALIAGGHWRAIAAATATVVVLALASWGAFGLDTWVAFFHSLSSASQSSLEQGRADWAKLQSVFGLVRMMGGSNALAWAAQGTLAAIVAVALGLLWRGRAEFGVKAAALVTGALLATPYIFLYDLVALAVPMAFLLRAGADGGRIPGEMLGLAAAGLLILIFPLVKAPVGFAAVLVVALLIARRASLAPIQGSRSEGALRQSC